MEPERRFAEFRVEAEGVIAGTAIRYGDTAKIGAFAERFEPGALRFDDVIANLMHRREAPVARTGAGLTLTDGPSSLEARIELPDTVYGREARELVQARILRGFSIEFRAEEQRWEGKTRIITRASLTGLGVVDRPAYPDSVIAERMQAVYDGNAPRPCRPHLAF